MVNDRERRKPANEFAFHGLNGPPSLWVAGRADVAVLAGALVFVGTPRYANPPGSRRAVVASGVVRCALGNVRLVLDCRVCAWRGVARCVRVSGVMGACMRAAGAAAGTGAVAIVPGTAWRG